MRVLGIDPGLRRMGWGIIDVKGNKLTHIANGVCCSQGDDLAARLLSLFGQMVLGSTNWGPRRMPGISWQFLASKKSMDSPHCESMDALPGMPQMISPKRIESVHH